MILPKNTLLTRLEIDANDYESRDFTASKVRYKFYVRNAGKISANRNYSFPYTKVAIGN